MRGPAILATCAAHRRAGAHRTCTRTRDEAPAAARSSTSCRRPRSCPPDRLHPGRRAHAGKPGQHQEGPVPRAGDMKQVVAKAPASGADNIMVVTSAARRSATTTSCLGHALAGDHARHRLPGRVRRDALPCSCRRAGHVPRRPARVRAGAGARGGRRRRRGHLSWRRTRNPEKALSDGPNAWLPPYAHARVARDAEDDRR